MTSKTEQDTLKRLFETAHQDDTPCPVGAQEMMAKAMTPQTAPKARRGSHALQWSLALGLVALSCLSIGIYAHEQTKATPTKIAVSAEPSPPVEIQSMRLDWEAPTDFLIEEPFAVSDTNDSDHQMTDILLEDHHDVF